LFAIVSKCERYLHEASAEAGKLEEQLHRGRKPRLLKEVMPIDLKRALDEIRSIPTI
jgi:hypothetical protein